MDQTGIGGLTDAEAYVVGADIDLGKLVSKGLALSVAYGHFEDENKTSTDIDELNVIVSYVMSNYLDAELIYANVDNDASPADVDTNFDRYLLRFNYHF